MLIKPLINMLALLLIGISVFAGAPQSGLVKAKFEIDGTESKDKFRILLYADGVAKPTVSGDGYSGVPPLKSRMVYVRFISGKYNLFYEDEYLAKLRGTLTFGVNEHLTTRDSHCKRGRKLVSSHSLVFEHDDAEGTGMVV